MRAGRCYRLGLCGLAVALACQAGCLSFCHPLKAPPAEEVEAHVHLPAASKNEVYVFFLHGLDPNDLANLSGLHDYVQSLGFIKTYYGQPFHAYYYEKEIRKLRQCDPNCKIALVGFSYGGGLIRDVACSVAKHGIDIDLLVYLDPFQYDGRPMHKPANVHRVVNVLNFSRPDSAAVDGAENVRYTDVWHYGTVTHPLTVRMLARELGALARQVPVVSYVPAPPPGEKVPSPELLPPPKEVGKRGEWDFLKPDAQAMERAGRKPAAEAFQSGAAESR